MILFSVCVGQYNHTFISASLPLLKSSRPESARLMRPRILVTGRVDSVRHFIMAFVELLRESVAIRED